MNVALPHYGMSSAEALAGADSAAAYIRRALCTATGSITLDGQPTAVVCDRTPHDLAETHNDAVLGDWDGNPND